MRPPMSIGELLMYWAVFVVFAIVTARALVRGEFPWRRGFPTRRADSPGRYWAGTIVFVGATLFLFLIVITQTFRR